MNTFQVGDRVVCVKADGSHGTREVQIGITGTIKRSLHGDCLAVEHDIKDDRMYHSCCGVTEDGCGWWYYPHELELIEESTKIAVDDLI